MRDSTALEEPLPTAISMITDATPIVMPRIVSPERNLLVVIPLQAMRTNWIPPTPIIVVSPRVACR